MTFYFKKSLSSDNDCATSLATFQSESVTTQGSNVLQCSIMLYNVLQCSIMFYNVLHCSTMLSVIFNACRRYYEKKSRAGSTMK